MFKLLRRLLVLFTVGMVLLAGSPATQAAGVFSRGHSLPSMRWDRADQPDDLIYQGGPVTAGELKLYLIILQPKGVSTTSTSADTQRLLIRFAQDAGSSPLYKMLSQYTEYTDPKAFPSSLKYQQIFIIQSPHPADHVYSDKDMKDIVSKIQEEHNIPADLHHLFAIFGEQGDKLCTEVSGKNYCSNQDFCAYHSFFGSQTTPTLYAVMGYPDMEGCQVKETPNQNRVADSDIDNLSHEIWEVATDPLVPGKKAWVDRRGQEIADKCLSKYGSSFPSTGGNVNWNGHLYEIQSEWDNATHSCTLGEVVKSTKS